VSIRVLHHTERAHGTGTVLVITGAEEMVHGTDTGIAGVDEGLSLFIGSIHFMCLRRGILSYISITVFLKILLHLRASIVS
jgi:hypothetical protein